MPFRSIFCVCFSFLIIGCGGNSNRKPPTSKTPKNDTSNLKSKDPTETDESENNGESDTTVIVHINGKAVSITYDKNYDSPHFEIARLANKFRHRRLDSVLIQHLDITGNGSEEKIIGHLYISGDSVFVSRKIYRDKKIIYSKVISNHLNDSDHFGDIHGIGAELTPLEPYASFYWYSDKLDVYEDTLKIDPSKYKSQTSDYLFFLNEILKDKHLQNEAIRIEKENFKKYLVKFKGAVLIPLHDQYDNPSPEIWYEPMKQFIPLD